MRCEQPRVEGHTEDFARVMSVEPALLTRRLEIDEEQVKNGLGQLVLTLVRLLHELMERQALRRMDVGDLSEEEVERLGTTLMLQAEEIDRLRQVFGLQPEDLNLDLGPLGRLL
jgi:hypothetical protein